MVHKSYTCFLVLFLISNYLSFQSQFEAFIIKNYPHHLLSYNPHTTSTISNLTPAISAASSRSTTSPRSSSQESTFYSEVAPEAAATFTGYPDDAWLDWWRSLLCLSLPCLRSLNLSFLRSVRDAHWVRRSLLINLETFLEISILHH